MNLLLTFCMFAVRISLALTLSAAIGVHPFLGRVTSVGLLTGDLPEPSFSGYGVLYEKNLQSNLVMRYISFL